MTDPPVVIVVVCAALAAVLAVVLFFKLLQRRRPAPLPPVQPLAHHRKYDHNHSFHSLDSSFPPPSPACTAPKRPLSSASLSSAGHMSRHTSRTTLRGLPHAPNSHVQVILPAPLSATLPRTDSDFVDKWVLVGRGDISTSTPRSSRRVSASAILPTASSYSYFQHSAPPPPVPPLPKRMITPS